MLQGRLVTRYGEELDGMWEEDRYVGVFDRECSIIGC